MSARHTRYASLAFAFATSQLLVLVSAGEIPFTQHTLLAVHHVSHIVLPLAAFVIFATFVVQDIARHGWPTFSWRLVPRIADDARTGG
jgi:hypothetical protein